MPNETNDFDISFTSQTSDGTIIVTSAEEIGKEKMRIALSTYDPSNDKYSVYLNEGVKANSGLTPTEIDDLLTDTQNSLEKVQKINAYNRKLINKNDIIGKTVESLDTNINTDIKITYGDVGNVKDKRNKQKQLDSCKELIKDVNEGIHIKWLL